MRDKARLFSLVFLIVFFITPQAAFAVGPQAKEIEQLLICPACTDTGMTVDYCPDGVAAGIRNQVEQKLATGQSKEQIVKDYVAEYGSALLAEPLKSGSGLLAWVMPAVGITVGVGLVLFLLKRRGKAQQHQTPDTNRDLLENDWQEKLDKELKKYV
jgi:cytochrome c-type biogenesis protein CcmH